MRITAAHLRRIIREEVELQLESESETEKPKGIRNISSKAKGGDQVIVRTRNILKWLVEDPELEVKGTLIPNFEKAKPEDPIVVFHKVEEIIQLYAKILRAFGVEEGTIKDVQNNREKFKNEIKKAMLKMPKETHGMGLGRLNSLVDIVTEGIPRYWFEDGDAIARLESEW